MLHRLKITNFAIVESLECECGVGLSVFTGETGAGKSILVEALRFLLGGRASAEMIRTGTEAAIVEGLFDWPDGLTIEGVDLGIAPDAPVWLRRELPLKGAGRCHINDHLVTRAALAAVGEHLGDLCGQHQQQILLDAGRHTEFLDAIAGTQSLANDLAEAWTRLSENRHTQTDLRAVIERRRKDRELRDFQIAEIRNAAITPGEDERLRAEAAVLKNARRLVEAAEESLNELSESDSAIGARIAILLRTARRMTEIDPRWNTVAEQLTLWQESLDEVTRHLADYRRQLDLDPARLETIETRLAELHRLKSKYGDSCAAILERLERLESEGLAEGREEERLRKLEAAEPALEAALASLAASLTDKRRAAAPSIETRINTVLEELGMKDARLRCEWIEFSEGGLCVAATQGLKSIHPVGAEAVTFTLESNPGEGFKPLDKIASGGELSRVLLALKSVGMDGSRNGHRPLFVFDEIDSGIGGAVAHSVAKRIKSLAKNGQVFLVSHLQQMAAAADTHFLITKDTRDNRARVAIRRLDAQERVREIARMVAGDRITDSTLQFAAELTNSKKPR